MSLRLSIWKWLYHLAVVAVLGAAVHICIVLFMPKLAQGDAWNRLEGLAKMNELAILPGANSATRPIAFMAPDVRYAVCRYDLSEGPLQLHTLIPNDLWSVALYGRHGSNYYLISGRDVQSRAISLLLVMDKTIDNEKQAEQNSTGAANEAVREITVSAPEPKGIIMIRAPVPSPAHENEVARLLEKAFCRPVSFAHQTGKTQAPPPPAR